MAALFCVALAGCIAPGARVAPAAPSTLPALIGYANELHVYTPASLAYEHQRLAGQAGAGDDPAATIRRALLIATPGAPGHDEPRALRSLARELERSAGARLGAEMAGFANWLASFLRQRAAVLEAQRASLAQVEAQVVDLRSKLEALKSIEARINERTRDTGQVEP